MTDFASPNRPLAMLTIDSLGKLSVSSIAGGGAVQSSLTSTHVGFGVNNVLSSSANFTFLSDRYLHFTGASANVNIGATSSGTAGFLESVNGNLLLQARSTFGVVVDDGFFQVNDLAGTGTRMVVASSTGVLSTQTIPSGGGSQTIDQVLTTGNTVAEQTLIFNNTTSDYLTFNNAGGTLKGGMSLDTDLFLVSTGVKLSLSGDTGLELLSGGEITLGNSGIGSLVTIAGTEFKLHLDDSVAGSYTPSGGDKILFNWDASKGAFVIQKMNTYNDGTRTFIIL